MDISAKCPQCDRLETLYHVFFYYDKAAMCWKIMGISYLHAVNQNIVHWVAYICKITKQEELADFLLSMEDLV